MSLQENNPIQVGAANRRNINVDAEFKRFVKEAINRCKQSLSNNKDALQQQISQTSTKKIKTPKRTATLEPSTTMKHETVNLLSSDEDDDVLSIIGSGFPVSPLDDASQNCATPAPTTRKLFTSTPLTKTSSASKTIQKKPKKGSNTTTATNSTNQRMTKASASATQNMNNIPVIQAGGRRRGYCSDLRLTIVNLAEPSGQIQPYMKHIMMRAITSNIMERMSRDASIVPRFFASVWQQGHLSIDCADLATRQLLIECVAQLNGIWHQSALSVIPRNDNHYFNNIYYIYKRVQLIFGKMVENMENFRCMLARQNPQLNICDWRLIDMLDESELATDIVRMTFLVDQQSFRQLQSSGGYIFCAFGRLLLHLYPERNLCRNSELYAEMLRCNIYGQYNLVPANSISWQN